MDRKKERKCCGRVVKVILQSNLQKVLAFARMKCTSLRYGEEKRKSCVMEAHARAPDPLVADGDMANNWQSWKDDFIIFMKITGYKDKPNESRANFLKNRIGKVGIDAIQNISFDKPEDKDDMDILIAKLEEYFNPPKKEVVERYQFFTISKKQNETFEQYVNKLKEKAKTCNFNDMTESIIRDKIILDTHDKILRKKLFDAKDLDLQKIIAMYNDYNINIEKMKQVTKENRTEQENSMQKSQLFYGKTTIVNNTKRPPCWRCARYHPQGKCPAWGSKCTSCGDINHFTQCCKGKLNPKYNDNKVNKNLLATTTAQQPKLPKCNDNWNNQPDSKPTTVKLMPTMSLPDVPKALSEGVSPSLGNDVASDFVILNTYSSYSNLKNNSAISQSAYFFNAPAYSKYSNAVTNPINPTSQQERLIPNSQQGKTNPTSQQERIIPNSQQGKTNPTTQQERTNPSSHQGRTNPSSQQGRIIPNSQQERIIPNSQQGRTSLTSQQGIAVGYGSSYRQPYIHASTNTNASRMPNSTSQNTLTCKNVNSFGKKKDEDKCVLC
ncbi:uncharacterized protein LOC105275970 isoform X1 [Ooceraea biroi]|uniref:uncharacterized protein LOC105275970 isoform X1 n=2 Tax=Ooceraea biroi TaxID=2015173 RepID=UPI000F091CE0|nr:uncharacterized protein LOC105275970 isoform X1 [Ooceraea biroi]